MPAQRVVQGNGTLATANSTTILDVSALGGTRLRLKTLVVTISVFTTSGLVEITDGTTTYFSWIAVDGKEGQPPCLNFPDGFDWGASKDLILTTTGTITAHVVAVAEIKGQA